MGRPNENIPIEIIPMAQNTASEWRAMMYYWKFSPSSKATLTEPPQPINLMITENRQEPQPLKWLKLHKAHQYLGVQLTADGKHKEELQLFQKQTD